MATPLGTPLGITSGVVAHTTTPLALREWGGPGASGVGHWGSDTAVRGHLTRGTFLGLFRPTVAILELRDELR